MYLLDRCVASAEAEAAAAARCERGRTGMLAVSCAAVRVRLPCRAVPAGHTCRVVRCRTGIRAVLRGAWGGGASELGGNNLLIILSLA